MSKGPLRASYPPPPPRRMGGGSPTLRTIASATSSDRPFDPQEIVDMIGGNFGLQTVCLSLMQKDSGVTQEQFIKFVRNRPGGKSGSELWQEFTSRRDAASAKPDFNFKDFVLEVSAVAKP